METSFTLIPQLRVFSLKPVRDIQSSAQHLGQGQQEGGASPT